MAATEEDSVDITFHGTGYNLSLVASENGSQDGGLAVDLEELASGKMWHGEFTAAYIENITNKTGSFKKFAVFVKMLMGALRQQSDTVFLDLLTYADLEALKTKKAGKADSDPSKHASNTKRYLILTYVAEYDRVHYPLPLLFEEVPALPSTQRLVTRLRKEVLAWKSLAGIPAGQPIAPTGAPLQAAAVGSLTSMQREVQLLRAQVADKSGQAGGSSDTVRALQSQLAATQEAASLSDAAIEQLRAASRAEVKRLRAEVASVTAAHEDTRAKLAAMEATVAARAKDAGRRESDVVAQLRETNEQLRVKVQQLTRQLALGTAVVAASTPGTPSSTAGAAAARGRTSTRNPYTAPVSPARGRSTTPRASSVGSMGSSRGSATTGPGAARRVPGVGTGPNTAKPGSSRGVTPPPTRTPLSATSTARRTPSQGSTGRAGSNSNSRTGGQGQGQRPVTRAGPSSSTLSRGSNLSGSGPVRASSVGSQSRSSTPGRPTGGSGGTQSRSSTPGRSSVGSAGGVNASRSTLHKSLPAALLSGLSPVTARIYTDGPRPTSQRTGSPSSVSRMSRTASRMEDGSSMGPIAKAYASAVEPMLAGLDAQRGMTGLHQTNRNAARSPGPAGRPSALLNTSMSSTVSGPVAVGGGAGAGASPARRVPAPAAPSPTRAGTGPRVSAAGRASPSRVSLAQPSSMSVRGQGQGQGAAGIATGDADVSQQRLNASAVSMSVSGEPVSASSGRTAGGLEKGGAGAGASKYDASADIDDIDARLSQLQNILKAAKAGQPLPEIPAALASGLTRKPALA